MYVHVCFCISTRAPTWFHGRLNIRDATVGGLVRLHDSDQQDNKRQGPAAFGPRRRALIGLA